MSSASTARRVVRQRDVMVLIHMGLTAYEASRRLGISVDAVKAHVSRCHQSWDAYVEDPGAKERVRRQVAEGLRCVRCYLLLPCYHEGDHE